MQEQLQIAKQIKDISFVDAIKDYYKIKHIVSNNIKTTPECRAGNKFIDYFTFPYRLQVISRKGFSFYQFVSMTEYHNKKYIKNLLNYQSTLHINELTKLYRIFTLHCGSVSLFKPLKYVEIIKQFQPKTILDPCAGWGGRMLASHLCNINYIGIDLNTNLKEPYQKMIETLNELTNTDIDTLYSGATLSMHFCDAISFDYSSINYDMVFTSPPYFNIELYPHTNKRTKTEWIDSFYKPLFLATYKNLLVNGWFCMNVNNEIYCTILIPLFGTPNKIISMNNKVRPSNYVDENIYCWQKLSPT